jgi:DNA mismatch repair protein MutS2
MLYPVSFEDKLGFGEIRKILKSLCLSVAGQQRVEEVHFSTDVEIIRGWLAESTEMKEILLSGEPLPSQDYYDLTDELLRIRIPGTYMEPEQLSELRLSLITILNLKQFLLARAVKFPRLAGRIPGFTAYSTDFPENNLDTANAGLIHPDTGHKSKVKHSANENPEQSPLQHKRIKHVKSGQPWSSARESFSFLIHPAPDVISQVDRILDEKTEIRDNASTELQRLRREKKEKMAAVERRVLQSFKTAKQSGWTPDDAEVTIRNGRLVIPMVSAHKRKIQGFVHDESSTGQTVYIEPADIFETNNEIREIEYAERREIIRILTLMTDRIRPDIESLLEDYQFLGHMDFIRAKARFAIDIEGVNPYINTDEIAGQPVGFRWSQARHPLLMKHLQRQGRKIVPLDLQLNNDRRILIISGPNAGGKSVCLKTTGLVQYLFQCGLLPPVSEDSEFCIFGQILIDIGDEQSIDNDLSTYTSKLKNLKYFVENVTDRSLFLIDELGTGTDPSLGGAIAEATLEALNNKGAWGVATTHYSNLKLLAGCEPGIVNGAMLFDLNRLKPLYQLLIGKPGSSFAFEIAHDIGFPEVVLQHARQKTGRSQLDFDRELQNLEVEKREIGQQSVTLKMADEFLAELIGKYEKLTTDLNLKKKEILDQAREEARRLLSDSNRIIEKTIREIRESQAEKEKTKAARELLNETKQKLLNPRIDQPSETHQTKPELADEKKPPISSDQVGSKAPPHRFQNYIDDLHRKLTGFSLTLDLRGKRAEEALADLQRYIDDAALLSIPEVRILHGKGNGILRQVTRNYLRTRKEVKSATDAAIEQGGAGITEVRLRQ